MTLQISRTRLLNGAALGLCSAFAALAFSGTAQAQSVCTNNTGPTPLDTFSCTNGGGTGTYSEAATFTPVAQGVQIGGAVPVAVTQAGTINTNNGASAVYVQTTGVSPVTYTSTGTTATTAPSTLNTYIRGSSVNATTNIVTANGALTRGVNTISDAGANTTVTGTTTVFGDGGYGIFANSNGGILNLTAGTTSLTSTTALGGGFGILSISTGGGNTTNATSTTVNANNAIGINASATGGILIVNSGIVIGTGINVIGVQTASTTGSNTTSGGTTTVIGVNSYGINASSNGGNLIVNGGTVGATGVGSYGIAATSVGGTNTVNGGTTTVTGVNTTGISATGNNGVVIVNTGAVTATGVGSIGVRTSTIAGLGTCGTSLITVTGNISADTNAVNADACGAGNVTVNAGRTVATTNAAGTTIVNNATGVATTTINGTVNAGASGNAAINNNGTSSVTTLNSGALVTGTFNGTVGADSFTIANGATLTTSGTSDFGTGADVLTNNGALTTTAATTFAGLETFANNGTLTLAPAQFSLPGSTSFTNTGTIRAEGGTTGITSLATLANSGNIDLQDGVTDDFLTLTGNYTGSGAASLSIDANSTSSDRLIVTGATSGSTLLNVNSIGGAFINTAGLLVVDNGTSTPNAFTLSDTTPTALIDYRLEQRGADYFLVASPNAIAFQPLALVSVAQDMWYQSADVYTGYAALRRGDLGTDRKAGVGVWAQLYASREHTGDFESVSAFGGDFDVNNRLKTKRRGAQGGVDYLAGNFVVGLTAGYQHANADFRSADGGFDVEGHNIGAYAMFGSANGLYGGLMVKRDRNEVRILNDAFNTATRNPDFKSNGIDGEIGYRFAMNGLNIDTGAGLSRVRSKIDDFSAEGLGYDFDRIKSLRGRVGARVGFGGSWGPYVDAKLLHEFKDNARLSLVSGTTFSEIETEARGTWARLEAGVGGHNGAGPTAAVWGDFGDVKGLGLKAGFRF